MFRDLEINAARDEVFRRVADFSTWRIWSPWLLAEPDAKVTVSDDPSSVGSNYTWDGEVVGAGQMTHKALEPGTLIDDEITFFRPWKSKADVSFELVVNNVPPTVSMSAPRRNMATAPG